MAALAVSTDYEALENLYTLFVAFFNLLVNLYGVTTFYVNNSLLLELSFDLLNNRLHNLTYFTLIFALTQVYHIC